MLRGSGAQTRKCVEPSGCASAPTGQSSANLAHPLAGRPPVPRLCRDNAEPCGSSSPLSTPGRATAAGRYRRTRGRCRAKSIARYMRRPGFGDFELYGIRPDRRGRACACAGRAPRHRRDGPARVCSGAGSTTSSLPTSTSCGSNKVRHKFHARHDAIARSYVYHVARRRTAFAKPFVWWVKDDLDVERMRARPRRASSAFTTSSPSRTTTLTRNRRRCSSTSIEIYEDGDLILIHIEGSHFLWKMVRRLVGVLVEIGRGGLSEVGRRLRC